MTLPVVPGNPMSFSQINTELGLTSTATISLNDAAVRTLAGVGASPATIAITNLSGKSNTFSFTIAASTTNANLRTLALAAGWGGSARVIATINSGVFVYSTSTGTPALTINGSFPSGVTLTNNGTIQGQGGKGGNGNGGVGSSGGLALSVSVAVTVTNNNRIAGGGGGGGGGGIYGEQSNPKYPASYAGGGGGGGGLGGTGGAGGAGGIVNPYNGQAGSAGSQTGTGSGGTYQTYGGAGGSYGATGAVGQGNVQPGYGGGGGSGGGGGGAVTGNSNITWSVTGTRNGGIS